MLLENYYFNHKLIFKNIWSNITLIKVQLKYYNKQKALKKITNIEKYLLYKELWSNWCSSDGIIFGR